MSIKLKGSSDGSVSLDAPADTSPSGTDVTFVLPTADGTAEQVLKTDGSGNLSFADNVSSGRNLAINGAMQVAQRGTSFTGITSDFKYITDQFRLSVDFGTFTGEQSSTAPSGFSNSIKVDCTTTGTPAIGTSENFVEHKIEAQNLQHLRYGESSAKSITLSFYVRSNKTGSYGVWFYAQDGNRQYVTTYSIQAVDTWEFKTLTVPGDASGAINNDNGAGIFIRWYLGAGSSYAGTPAETWETAGANRATSLNLADSTSNEWFITGVQLEVGEVATSFEHRSFGDELAKCQRYFYKIAGNTADQVSLGVAYCYQGTNGDEHVRLTVPFPVTMRSDPAFSSNNLMGLISASTEIQSNSSGSLDESIYSCGIDVGFTSSSLGAYNAIQVRLRNLADSHVSFDAEM